MAREAKTRKCTAKIAEQVQMKIDMQHRSVIHISNISPAMSISRRYTTMCVIGPPHNFAGMISLMRCQITKLSPAFIDTFAQNELKLFQTDNSRNCMAFRVC